METLLLETPGEDAELVRLFYVEKALETFAQTLLRVR